MFQAVRIYFGVKRGGMALRELVADLETALTVPVPKAFTDVHVAASNDFAGNWYQNSQCGTGIRKVLR